MTKNIVLGVLGLLALVFGGLLFTKSGQAPVSFGGMPLLEMQTFQQGIQIGTRGSKYTFKEKGTCTLLANFSITASTTRSVSCAVESARSGDVVMVNLLGSTTLASQYIVKSSQASTTSGFIEVQLYNATGGSVVPAATDGFGSTTTYLLERYGTGF